MKRHPLEIEINSTVRLTPSESKTLKAYLEGAARVVEQLLKEGMAGRPPKAAPFRLSLLICGDATVRRLNRDHRGKDKITDVLSFPAHEGLRRGIKAIHFEGDEVFLGDMAICHPQTRRQARRFKIGYWDEFIHLFFHGLLHLFDYDHELSLREEKLMQKWEERALTLFSEIKKKGAP